MTVSPKNNLASIVKKTLVPFKNYQKPERVFWWWELICNLGCNHCDIGKKTLLYKFRPALTLEKKKLILDKLHKWIGNGFSLSFIAGEPFLHKDIFDILAYASERKIVTSLTSNGTLISTQKQAEKVIKSGLNFIAISLDGLTPQIHDKSRGRVGVWKQTMSAIKYLKSEKKRLKKKNPTIYINSIIMRDNLKDLVNLTKWVKDEKLDGITFQPIATTDFFEGDGSGGPEWYKKSPLWPKRVEVLKFIDTIEQMKENGWPIKNSAKDFQSFRDYFNDPVEFALKESCEGELKSMIITHDGLMKMCPGSHETFGNVLKENLDSLWHSKAADKARQHVYECESQCKILANTKEDFYF